MENINPLISIITAVKNGEKHLEECFESLQNQSYKNFEHIVIDGGSTDRTLEIINNHKSKIKFFSSQKDEGIYDGFNKGMEQASGEYLGFLNSDDILLPDALMTLKEYIVKKNYPDFIFGSVRKHWGILHGYKPWKIKFSWGFYSSHSTGFYIKKSSAKIIGKYDLRYKYSSDYDYFYRMIVKHKMRGVATKKNEIFGVFRRGGFSSKISFYDHFTEEIKIRLNNKQNRILVLLIYIYKYIKNLSKL